MQLNIIFCLFNIIRIIHSDSELLSRLDHNKFSIADNKKYILYDVNHGEGFNLRRDVYMRMANLVRSLRENNNNVVLVLPQWGGIYHWQSESIGQQIKIPWSLFFDLASLANFIPVIEFDEFLKEIGQPIVDEVYYLQGYAEGWTTDWEEKWNYRPCLNDHHYYHWDKNDKFWYGWFFGYENVKTRRFNCISIQGHASMLKQLILAENNTARSIMFDRAETVLHDTFGDVNYWKARRSMRYSKKLVEIANDFRLKELDSDDERDQTTINDDWTAEKVTPGRAIGGPYLCVHWRRKDFVRSYSKEIPSIEGTSKEIVRLLNMLNLTTVFLATDASQTEVDELKSMLPENVTLKQYLPSQTELETYKDGGVSIIDQWICAHAKYFTGSHVSTFTFRIQDDREMLGFAHASTFNRMCPDHNPKCEPNSRWTLVQ